MNTGYQKIADGFSMVADGFRFLQGAQDEKNIASQTVDVVDEMLKKVAKQTLETQQTEVTIEQVRSVMAVKSQEGKTKEVKVLLQKYGADKLSGVQPEQYADLLKEAEKL